MGGLLQIALPLLVFRLRFFVCRISAKYQFRFLETSVFCLSCGMELNADQSKRKLLALRGGRGGTRKGRLGLAICRCPAVAVFRLTAFRVDQPC